MLVPCPQLDKLCTKPDKTIIDVLNECLPADIWTWVDYMTGEKQRKMKTYTIFAASELFSQV